MKIKQKMIILPDDMVQLWLSEEKILLILKALKYYTPTKEEEPGYWQLTELFEFLSLEE